MTEDLAYELVHVGGSVQLGPRSGFPPEASGDLVHAGPLLVSDGRWGDEGRSASTPVSTSASWPGC